jgi:hypothetical protein
MSTSIDEAMQDPSHLSNKYFLGVPCRKMANRSSSVRLLPLWPSKTEDVAISFVVSPPPTVFKEFGSS